MGATMRHRNDHVLGPGRFPKRAFDTILHVPFSKTVIFLGGAAPQTTRWGARPPPRLLCTSGPGEAGRPPGPTWV